MVEQYGFEAYVSIVRDVVMGLRNMDLQQAKQTQDLLLNYIGTRLDR